MVRLRAERQILDPAAGEQPGTPVPGEPGVRRVDAATPWLCESPEHFWRVDSGRVDIFAVDVRGPHAGRRTLLRSFDRGDVLGGYGSSPDGQCRVIAVGVLGTSIVEVADGAVQPVEPEDFPDLWSWIDALAVERVDKEAERVRRSQYDDDAEVEKAAALVYSQTLVTPPPPMDPDELRFALIMFARSEGYPLPEGAVGAGADLLTRIQPLLAAMGGRGRVVELESQWWLQASDSFLGQFADGRTVAVIAGRGRSRSGTRYWVSSTGDRGLVPLTVDEAAGMSQMAIVVQPVLGPGPQTLRALMLRTARSIRGEFAWTAFLALCASAMSLLIPITLGKIVSTAVPNHQTSVVIGLACMLAAAAFASFIFEVSRNVTMFRLGGRIDRNLLPALWDRVLRLPVDSLRSYQVGDLSSRILEIDQSRVVLTESVLLSALSVAFTLVNVALIAVVVPVLLLPALVVLAIFGVIATLTTRSYLVDQRQYFEQRALKDSLSLQLVKGIAKIRVAGATARMFQRWVVNLDAERRPRDRLSMKQNIVGISGASLGLACSAAVYITAMVNLSGISVAAYVVFASSLGMLTMAVSNLAQIAGQIGSVRNRGKRILPILQDPTEDVSSGEVHIVRGGIRFQHLWFHYADQTESVLKDLSLTIPEGSFTAIVGPSGCGKSTLLRCLLGFEQPQRGTVLIDDVDLAGLDLRTLRRQFGVVLQQFSMLGGSIRDNIAGVRRLTEDEVWEAAEKVGLADFIRTLPMGMATILVDGSSTLSGGQVQRLMLARAIAGYPRLIILDEATSALDNPTQEQVSASLAAMDCTRIVVAHRLSTVRDADQIAVMDAGRVVELGRHEELLALDGHYATLVRRQLS